MHSRAASYRVATSSWLMFALFTERARTAIVRARHSAGPRADDHIGTAHLLLGLIAGEEPVAELLRSQWDSSLGDPSHRARVDADATAAQVERSHILIGLAGGGSTAAGPRLLGVICDDGHTADSLRSRGIPVTEAWQRVPDPGGPSHENCPHHRPFTADVAEILQHALALTERFGHDRVDSPHILLALTLHAEAPLRQLGVDPVELRRNLSATLAASRRRSA